MDRNRFDGFTRQLAQRENRRQAIKTLLAGGVGTAAVVLAGNGADAKGKPVRADCCPATAPKLCGLTCTDVSSDVNNCGACGTTCFSYQTCISGVCSGDAPQCTKPDECQPSANECVEQTCIDGLCGFANRPIGTLVTDQTPPGDCKRTACDGNGGTTIINGNDPPQEFDDCFMWACNNGTAYKEFAPSGVPCNGGTSTCNGAGVCSQCATAGDCPGEDNECQTRTCTNGTCGFNFVAAGTPVAQQTLRDCQREVCDGNGTIIFEIDNTDVPLSLDDCLTGACNAGSPGFQPVAAGTNCNDGVCDGAGECVECVSPIHCFEPDNAQATCVANICGFDCDLGFGSCDPDGPVGCPTNFNTDPSNCGFCGQICSNQNGIGICNQGQCEIICNAGYANCDGMVANGCEINTQTDMNNCGGCGNACSSNNGTRYCSNGECQITCHPGFANCNLDAGTDGCETDILSDPGNCGSCSTVCPSGICNNGICG